MTGSRRRRHGRRRRGWEPALREGFWTVVDTVMRRRQWLD